LSKRSFIQGLCKDFSAAEDAAKQHGETPRRERDSTRGPDPERSKTIGIAPVSHGDLLARLKTTGRSAARGLPQKQKGRHKAGPWSIR
jgi:hypothetical protein